MSTITIDSRYKKRLRGMFSKYEFEIGILEDGPHKDAQVGARGQKGADVRTTYAGGPVRKKSRRDSGLKISDVSKEMRERLGFNYLSEPFKKSDSDIIKFSNEFLKLVFNISKNKKRVENLLQAIVRNPILRGDYGSNSQLTQKIKGFDRKMIDTAQLFKAIKAKVKVRGV